MSLLAVLAVAANNTSALEKLKHVPPAFWLKVGIAIAAVIAVVVILRKLAQVNKVVLGVVLVVVFSAVGFSWIYERNEPAWATPVVEWLAGFFPSKGAYATRQSQ